MNPLLNPNLELDCPFYIGQRVFDLTGFKGEVQSIEYCRDLGTYRAYMRGDLKGWWVTDEELNRSKCFIGRVPPEILHYHGLSTYHSRFRHD